MKIVILESAHKHGVQNHDIIYVLENYIAYFELDDNETKKKIEYVGFDSTAKILEIITVEVEDDKVYVIHAMKATKTALKRTGLL